ncbi:MAG: outer membrane lipoprotein-sorting protein [Proteobacteria bacterium]|nr:MAG: outer membrane lipoprotein-sorting protein [Pseudomonadota bacterium]PIE40185.1 MAG: outer membrane lipoprotein-sorting protein [Gammaproteobacteria bacterium]
MYNKKTFVAGFLLLFCFGIPAGAKVSKQEADRLGKELTPFGAIKKGNRAGTIPAWTGGLTTPPPRYKRPGQHHPDPFPKDKPLFTITAQNVNKYAARLSPGVRALIKTYPTSFKLPVYTSRRTHTAPDWVIKNTAKNALTATLAGGGNGVENAYGGIPFPILSGSDSEKALQAIWNHMTRWRGVFVTRRSSEVAVQRNGDYTLVSSQQEVFWNFYNPEGSVEDLDNILSYYLSFTKSPARLAGGAILVHETIDQLREPRKAWGYSKGQRRVRRAPNLAYDSPIAAADNLRTADDTDLYNGSPDLYNWTYKGLKEYYIPYNSYKVSQSTVKYKDLLSISHINPEYTRWELHRTHVVEANLKAGSRHIYKKRVFYIDEDSWNVALADQFDSRGELWRVSMAFLKNFYELPGVWTAIDVFYDLQARRYHVQGLDSEERDTRVFENKVPDSRYFKPRELRRRGR